MKRLAILVGLLALAAPPAVGQARVSVSVVLGAPRPHASGVVVVGRRHPHRVLRHGGAIVVVQASRPRYHRGGLVVVRERVHRVHRHHRHSRECRRDDD